MGQTIERCGLCEEELAWRTVYRHVTLLTTAVHGWFWCGHCDLPCQQADCGRCVPDEPVA